MITSELFIKTTSFFALMTVSFGLPRNGEILRYASVAPSQNLNYDPTTERTQNLITSRPQPLWFHEITTIGRRHFSPLRRHITTTPSPKWVDHHVLVPTTERFQNSGLQRSSGINGVAEHDTVTERRHLRPKQHSSQNNGQVSPMKKIVNSGPERRVGITEDYDCEEPVATSNIPDNKRSPYLGSNSKVQTFHRSGLTTKRPCRRSHQQYVTPVNETTKQNLPLPVNRTPSFTNSSNKRDHKEKGGIVFPDGKKPIVFVPRKSKCPGATFCEEYEDDYPKEYMDGLLQNDLGTLRGLFGEDLLNYSNITQRIDVNDDSDSICPSKPEIIFPKTAYNKEDQLLFIFNQDKHTQGIQVETCKENNGPCNFSQSFPVGYKTWCKQKYVYRRLLALNPEGKAVTDSFRLPSCCSCHYKLISASRMLPSDVTPVVKPKNRKRRK